MLVIDVSGSRPVLSIPVDGMPTGGPSWQRMAS
jgi:hypothetical protein